MRRESLLEGRAVVGKWQYAIGRGSRRHAAGEEEKHHAARAHHSSRIRLRQRRARALPGGIESRRERRRQRHPGRRGEGLRVHVQIDLPAESAAIDDVDTACVPSARRPATRQQCDQSDE